jgi:hypothetical protein
VTKEKRSQIHDERLAEFRQHKSIYVITCGLKGCPCSGKDEGCGRGLFSLFLQAIYGIDFSLRIGMPYHIDFGNIAYCYSDEKLSDRNFWNYYFQQPIVQLPKHANPVFNKFIELYPLRIWNKSHFREIHNRIIKDLKLIDDLQFFINKRTEEFRRNKILGVHIRGTDHSDEVPPVKFEKYTQTINKFLPTHDRLFVATDDLKLLQRLKELYRTKIMFNEVARSDDEIPIHLNRSISNGRKLGYDVILDCYCLSLCKKAILSHSNVSYSALMLNPELSYILLERPGSKVKRLKTILLYHLNKWNIRKW